MHLFNDDLIEEYSEWKGMNPETFSWWSYVNMKADIDIALGFAKFFAPEIVFADQYLLLKDHFNNKPEIFESWKNALHGDKTLVERAMNTYEIKDFFHNNVVETSYDNEKIEALGAVLKFFWDLSFKSKYPDKKIAVDVARDECQEDEYEDLYITVYEDCNPDK